MIMRTFIYNLYKISNFYITVEKMFKYVILFLAFIEEKVNR